MEMQDTLIVVSLTQAEINAIPTPETAGIVYNSTTSTVQFYDGSAWVNGSGEFNTASNVGAGSEVFKAKVGDDLEFRSLIGGTNVTLVPGTDDITINASGGGGGGDLLSTNNLSDVTNAVTSLGNLGGEPAFAKNTGFNKDLGIIAGTVLEGDKNAAIVLNTAKVTNATHTGEVTGSGSLTVDPTAISNKASVTAAAGMEVLINDAGTLKKADASDFLGGGSLESFYLERVETIDNNSGTAIEYFTEVQGGTEITNTVTAVGGTYNFELSFVCRNTSNNGSCDVNLQLNTSDIFAVDYSVEPDDGNNVYYVNISKRVTLSAGVNTIDINLSNAGSGTARIYEANVIISKV